MAERPTPPHAEVPPPAPAVTLERAGAYFELLCDLGLDRAIDEAAATARPERPRGRAVESMAAPSVEADPAAGTVRLDLGLILRECGRRGALARLGAVVLGVPVAEAAECTADELREAYYPFVYASWGLIRMLLDSLSASE